MRAASIWRVPLLHNSMEKQQRAIIAGIAGNVMEWYDFTVYGYFAAVIGHRFFPAEDPVSPPTCARPITSRPRQRSTSTRFRSSF